MDALFKLARDYGEPCTVYFEEGSEGSFASAFIEPLMDRRSTRIWREMTELGEIPGMRYIYVGPPDLPLKAGSRIVTADRDYEVIWAESYKMKNKTTHWEAVLRLREVPV
ncbi:MAG TPA: hypothetical protein GXZ65_00810 [Clostridiales bacterium]|jgi:hypothetical protein|nr:hypothetical protein [Clostridiales bacterium]